VKLLIKAGAQVTGITDDSKWSPLAYSLYRGHILVSELLMPMKRYFQEYSSQGCESEQAYWTESNI
jgi:ankyrin repeat protein